MRNSPYEKCGIINIVKSRRVRPAAIFYAQQPVRR
nr:MAG TPA: hypothetical protein [Bacteriophage sp.]